MTRAYDLSTGWLDQRHATRLRSEFLTTSVEERLKVVKEEVHGGSVPDSYMQELRRLVETSGRLELQVGEVDEGTALRVDGADGAGPRGARRRRGVRPRDPRDGLLDGAGADAALPAGRGGVCAADRQDAVRDVALPAARREPELGRGRRPLRRRRQRRARARPRRAQPDGRDARARSSPRRCATSCGARATTATPRWRRTSSRSSTSAAPSSSAPGCDDSGDDSDDDRLLPRRRRRRRGRAHRVRQPCGSRSQSG